MSWLNKLHALTQLPLFAPDDQPDAMVVRTSLRARRLSLRVYPAGRIEVVVPPHTPARIIQEFVARNRVWLNDRLTECQTRQSSLSLPDEVLLPALERRIVIQSRQEPGVVRLRQMTDEHWLLRGDVTQPQRWSHALMQGLAGVAMQEFAPRLEQLATQCGFEYERLQIRRQRTRWGSCSTTGTISLNVCALFLKPEQLRYLMIHELSHTRHMNHSKRFWDCVARHEPDWQMLDKQLTGAWKHMPIWLFLGKSS